MLYAFNDKYQQLNSEIWREYIKQYETENKIENIVKKLNLKYNDENYIIY